VAVTAGPGLVGSLLVGLSGAKALSLAWDTPLVGVNHLEGHLFAALLEAPDLQFPVVVLVVSGGHSFLVDMQGPGKYRLLGQTIDDAAGEAFDKVSRYLGLGYPGGPAIEKAAREGNPKAYRFPRALRGDGLNFSFSGLKTAVVRLIEREPEASSADVAASFQAAVVEILVEKTAQAASDTGAKAICLGGRRREAFSAAGAELGIEALVPSRAMCTDNAAMVAAAGAFRFAHGDIDDLSRAADPNWFLDLEA
ncbi:MAG: tRNA (adenosine(37)-N6)-threonylcarbamoyltransferase complex transferase subunit TsaD, partial [Actinobacteria bacterium]|nr:tRNA (adenosine(37)-N6)-threonylcarbamoyltransferase complex transferase subunit TsaD [Actinomycetota bacterium]